MKIYTRTGMKHLFFKKNAYYIMDDTTQYEKSSVFWHDQHDAVIKNVSFDKAFPKNALEHIRQDSTSKILLFYGDEYYNLNDLTLWAETIKKENIPSNQIYIICIDENWKTWSQTHLSRLGIDDINIQSLNLLMNRVDIQDPIPVKQKFSAFSRNYVKFRLEFFVNLVNRDLLGHFDYTFNNIMPYGDVVTYTQDSIHQHVEELGYTVDKKLKRWIKGIPYTIEGNDVRQKMSNEIYDKISSSAINVVIESHFDPFWNFFKDGLTTDFRDFSPAFPTEKIYKAVGCNRPFIVISTPEFLKEFRQLGYKTFHPYINETYDTIENNNDRMQAIANEIERIANLSTEEYDTLILECEKIANYNTKVLAKSQENSILDENFKWLHPVIDKNNRWYSKAHKEI